MRTLFYATLMALLLTHSQAQAYTTPCDDARKDFKRAQAYGATNFKCTDRYDGSATSSWTMEPEKFKAFREAELERKRQSIKRRKK